MRYLHQKPLSPPRGVGKSRFLALEGLPRDHYLWLTGQGGRLLRNEIKETDDPAVRRM